MKRFLLILVFAFLFINSFSQDPDVIWQEGLKKFEEKDFHGVIEKMNEYLEIISSQPYAIYNRGIAKLNLGDIEGACADLSLSEKLGFKVKKQLFSYLCIKDEKFKFLKKAYYKHTDIFPENGCRPYYTRKDTLRGALRPERTCFDVLFYNLTVRIIPKGKKITGENEIYFMVTEPSDRIQIDLFDNYLINSITWNGRPLKYSREYNAVFIDFPQVLHPKEHHSIVISYSGKPDKAKNPPWEGGFVWKKDNQKKHWVGVACEHLGASSWWPNKDHLTDEPDSMKINIEVPIKYKAISNGILRNVVKAGGGYDRYEWFVSYPINNYNVTFYMGHYEYLTDTLQLNDKSLLMKYYVLPYHTEKAKQHFKQANKVVKFYSNVFGEYPFINDGFGLVESPYAGMEHQSAIAYGNDYGVKNDEMYRNSVYDYIIVHEAAHEWWGNSVSAGDMADIWIHEGFATYAELLFLEKMFGKDEYNYELNEKRKTIFNFWPLVQNYNVNENSFASNDVYTKGATLLHCLRCTINNDSLFFRIIKEFCVEKKYKIVTTNDFIEFVNYHTKDNYHSFFKKYLYDTGLPVLKYKIQEKDTNLIFTFHWEEVDEGFKMPFCIRTNDGKALRIEGTTEEKQVTLSNTKWFNFYNEWQNLDGVVDNSYTYFHTKWIN